MATTEAKRDAGYVTEQLRQAITEGELAPGQRLVEADLVDMFGASRGAVRVALVTLTGEGLVERIQNRGARVRAIDLEDALEIVELRTALEGICAGKAAERASDADIERLRSIGARMAEAVERGDNEEYSACNGELHGAVLEVSAMKIAPEIVTRLRAQNVRYRIRLALQPERPSVSLPEHLAIVDAIANRDAEAAKAAMQAHLTSVGKATRDFFARKSRR